MATAEQLALDRVVIAYSDVFGPAPINGEPAHHLVDVDTVLNQQFGNGKFHDTEFGISDWPGVARHGLVVLDKLREAQLDEIAQLGITPEQAAQMTPAEAADLGLRKHQYDTVRSLGNQSILGVANHAPRTEELRRAGRNGQEFHYGRTKSGLEVVAHPQFLRDLRDEGRLEAGSVARIPNAAAVQAGVWKKGEQYRSRFAGRLADYPELHESVPAHGPDSPIGYDQRPDGGASYVDHFGNLIVAQHDISQAGRLITESVGREVDMILTRGADGAEVAIRGVAAVQSLATAPGNKFSAYLNPDEYVDGQHLGGGRGHVEVACRVDDPTDTQGSAYVQLVDQLKSEMPGFSTRQLDDINVRFEAA